MVDLLQFYNEIVDDIVKVYRGFEAYLDSVSKIETTDAIFPF